MNTEKYKKLKEDLKIKLYNEGGYIKELKAALHYSLQEKLKRNELSNQDIDPQLEELTKKLYKSLDVQLDDNNLYLEKLTKELTKEYNEDCKEEIEKSYQILNNIAHHEYGILVCENRRIRKIIDDYNELEEQIKWLCVDCVDNEDILYEKCIKKI